MAPSSEQDLLHLAAQRTLPDISSPAVAIPHAFLKGAYSFPHDWWLAIQWSLGLQGVYGDHMQRKCRTIAARLDLLLLTIRTGGDLTYKAVSAAVRYVLTNENTRCVAMQVALNKLHRRRALLSSAYAASSVAGRYAGGVFTHYAATGGRFGGAARSGAANPGLKASHFVLASLGAVIRLAINTGGTRVSAADLALSVVAGLADRLIDEALWRELVRAAAHCDEAIDHSDHLAFNQLFRDIIDYVDTATVR